MKVGNPALGSIVVLITPLLTGVGCGEDSGNRASEQSMADAAIATDESARSQQDAPAADQPSADAPAPSARDAEAAVASSGQGIKCSVTTWAGPSAPRVDAVCGVRRSDHALGDSAPTSATVTPRSALSTRRRSCRARLVLLASRPRLAPRP